MGTDAFKERERVLIANEVEGLITRITGVSNQTHELVSQLSFAVGGTSNARAIEMRGGCREAIQEMSRALQELFEAKRCVVSLDTSDGSEDQ